MNKSFDKEPLVVEGKNKTSDNEILPQWNFVMKLSRAAGIIRSLQENQGFIRAHRLRNPSVPRPASKSKTITGDSADSEQVNNSPSKKRKISPPQSASIKEMFRYLPGWHVEQCKLSRPIKTKPNPKRQRASQGLNCPAKIQIKFQEGYHHTEDNSLNVRDFGDMLVMVKWIHCHNHKHIPVANRKNAQQVRLAIREAVADVTWRQFITQRNKWMLQYETGAVPSEVFKINYQLWFNESRRHIRSLAVKDSCREKSLCLWAKDIKALDGMAEFTDQFDFKKKIRAEDAPKTSEGGKIWSFWFMSTWQKDLLHRNSSIIFLDSTHKTCRGLNQREDVYLFTLYVKNAVTGKGAPAAFMMTNSQRSEVIAHFLKAVRAFCSFQPVQAVIDCDQAETNALKEVWQNEVSIVWCRWHILKAFANSLKSKVTVGPRGGQSREDWDAHKQNVEIKKKEITQAFKNVIASPTQEIGEQRISDFMKRFKEYPQLIEYTARQWFAKKEFVVNGMAPNILVHASTNNFIESFHNVLKRYFLGRSRSQGPDFLVFKLFFQVELNYRAEEKMVKCGFQERVHDKGEKKASKKAFDLSQEVMKKWVSFESEGKVKVRSFTTSDQFYYVGLDTKSRQNVNCTCKAYENSLSWCKHIFLGWRWHFTREQEGQSDEQENYVCEYIDSLEAIEDNVEDDDELDKACFSEAEDLEFSTPEHNSEEMGMSGCHDYKRPLENETFEEETYEQHDTNGTVPVNTTSQRPLDLSIQLDDHLKPKTLLAADMINELKSGSQTFKNAVEAIGREDEDLQADLENLLTDFSPAERIVEDIKGKVPEIIDQDHLGNIQLVRLQVKHAQEMQNLENRARQKFNNYLDKLANLIPKHYIKEHEKLNHFLDQPIDPQKDSACIKQRQVSPQKNVKK